MIDKACHSHLKQSTVSGAAASVPYVGPAQLSLSCSDYSHGSVPRSAGLPLEETLG